MVQLSTPWGDPLTGEWAPVRRFLSNYFDLLFCISATVTLNGVKFCMVIELSFGQVFSPFDGDIFMGHQNARSRGSGWPIWHLRHR